MPRSLPFASVALFDVFIGKYAMGGQQADLDWREGDVPVSLRFDDPYYSLENGLAETRYVFLDGNGLPDRFRPGFHVAELGFGTGLNFLTTWAAWHASGVSGPLCFTSFEAFPLGVTDMHKALDAFPELQDLSSALLNVWPVAGGTVDLGTARLTVIAGDAREELPVWGDAADAWYLDGFSPAKNPELWEDALLAEVGRHTKPGGTVATYTAAGFVRRGLDAAGFHVARRPGFGRKRHMTVGQFR